MLDEVKINCAINDVKEELERATKKFGSFNSSHEGYAVIKEEFDELWDEIMDNKKPGSIDRQIEEAIQVAAMATRFVVDMREKYRIAL